MLASAGIGGPAWWLALAVAWLAWMAPDRRARVAVVVGAVAAAGVARAVAWWIAPEDLAVGALQPVREGDSFILVSLSWAVRGYTLREPWWDLLGATPWARLDGAVVVSLALGAACAVVVAVWARWRTQDRLAPIAIVGGLVLSPIARVAVMSGDVGPLLWPWLLLAMAGLGVLWTRPGWGATLLGGAWSVLALTVPGSDRAEVWAIGAVSLAILGIHRLGVWRRVQELSPDRRRVVWGAVAVGVALAAAVPFDTVLWIEGQVGKASPAIRVFHPLDGAVLWVVPFLLASATPGLALLVLRGALRAPAANLGLGVAALVLFKMAHSAGHGRWLLPIDPTPTGFTVPAPLELLRYCGYVLPVWAVLAVEGWRVVGPKARRWMALLAFLPAAPLLVPMEDGKPGWTSRGHLDRDATREVRALVAASRAAPGAWFSAPLRPDEDGRRWYGWRASIAGQRYLSPVVAHGQRPPPPSDRMDRIYWHGLACNAPGAGCAPPPGRLVWSWTFPARPHIAASHRLPTTDPVTLRLWVAPPLADESDAADREGAGGLDGASG